MSLTLHEGAYDVISFSFTYLTLLWVDPIIDLYCSYGKWQRLTPLPKVIVCGRSRIQTQDTSFLRAVVSNQGDFAPQKTSAVSAGIFDCYFWYLVDRGQSGSGMLQHSPKYKKAPQKITQAKSTCSKKPC
jgi:hypothetical protein